MRKEWSLTQEAFDRLLIWLDADRERAGAKYEAVRARLIRIFMSRGCAHPEELADETINRVSAKVSELVGRYEGDPASFFFGVANNVHLEYRRASGRVYAPPPRADYDAESAEARFSCLDECLDALPADARLLVLEYYREEGQSKIDHRRALAARLRVGMNALRIRVFRIRADLERCVGRCVDVRDNVGDR